MRDLTSIEAMLPDLENKLAFMYYVTVKKSKHIININRQDYRTADVHLNAINLLIACGTDIEEINFHLNEFLKYIETCCLPEVCSPDVIELQCVADDDNPTFWVPDDIACEVTTTTTTTSTTTTTTAAPVLYSIYATVDDFVDPDLVGYFLPSITNVEVILLAETGSNKQYVIIEDTFPKTVTAIYTYSYALAMYININKLSEYTFSTPTGFRKYLYNGAKRGTTKIKIVFS